MKQFCIMTGQTRYGTKMVQYTIEAESIEDVRETEEYALAKQFFKYVQISETIKNQ